jgi:hypothetical protein
LRSSLLLCRPRFSCTHKTKPTFSHQKPSPHCHTKVPLPGLRRQKRLRYSKTCESHLALGPKKKLRVLFACTDVLFRGTYHRDMQIWSQMKCSYLQVWCYLEVCCSQVSLYFVDQPQTHCEKKHKLIITSWRYAYKIHQSHVNFWLK